jgi:glycosyltransferase involved in cell wall biosynthesis
MSARPPHIAIVHDWLVSMRGGEKVLEVLCELYPEATLFTLVRRPGSASPSIERMEIQTSFLQHLPLAERWYQYYLPLYPLAAARLDLRGYDLVLSSSHAAAKAVHVDPGARHICYCHTPMRYIWDQFDQYFGPGRASWPVRAAMRAVRGPLQRWDVASAAGVGTFLANSRTVQERIRRIYGRDSQVIPPPVSTDAFQVSHRDDGYFLVVSALVPYKRVDLAVDACTRTGQPLLVVGDGAELGRLRERAGANVTFAGRASDARVREAYEGCSALLFPGEEDFGIVPVEAMACGKPVIAFGRGGATETVTEGVSGTFFPTQDVDALVEAIGRARAMRFDPDAIRAGVARFDRALFRERIASAVEAARHT